jgi:hypothetical protein
MQLSTPPDNDQRVTPRNDYGPREAGPELPLLVACVPFCSKGLLVSDKRWRLTVAGNCGRHFIGHQEQSLIVDRMTVGWFLATMTSRCAGGTDSRASQFFGTAGGVMGAVQRMDDAALPP